MLITLKVFLEAWALLLQSVLFLPVSLCVSSSSLRVYIYSSANHSFPIFLYSSVAALADQKSARTGNVLGIAGVSFGLAATTADMSLAGAAPAAFEQVGLLAGVGGTVGAAVASKVGPTELPQTVAAFHSLVGIAASKFMCVFLVTLCIHLFKC